MIALDLVCYYTPSYLESKWTVTVEIRLSVDLYFALCTVFAWIVFAQNMNLNNLLLVLTDPMTLYSGKDSLV